MTKEPKTKILIFIIAILFVANMVTLYLLLERKPQKDRQDRRAGTISFLKNKVGFTEEQMVAYDSLHMQHRRNVKSIFQNMGTRREETFKNLSAAGFNDSAIVQSAELLSGQQKEIEIKMLTYIRSIRNLNTAEQLPAFDSGFYKLLVRKPEVKTQEKKPD